MSKISITQKNSTHNTSAMKGRKILYILVHYTAGVTSKPGSAANTASYFATTTNQASADFIVDDANIVQYNGDLENRYCWHCGGSKYKNKGGSLYGIAKNNNSIGIEVCSTNDTGKMTAANDSHYSFTDAVIDNTIELVRYLMDRFHIDIDHVIRHYDVNGKPCPGIKGWNIDSGSDAKWIEFKNKVVGNYTPAAKPSNPINESTSSKVDTTSGSAVNYNAKVTASDGLNVRKGPSTKYSIVKTLPINTAVTIIRESNGWGLLSDKSGWVSLTYTSKVTSAPTVVANKSSFIVRVTDSALNIRKGPGTNYSKVGCITDKGSYTIVETQPGPGSKTGWGRLKSGAGWISLDYTKKK